MENNKQSKLSPTRYGWIADLPKAAEAQEYRPYLDQEDELLNHLDNTWCEWARPSSLNMRGGIIS